MDRGETLVASSHAPVLGVDGSRSGFPTATVEDSRVRGDAACDTFAVCIDSRSRHGGLQRSPAQRPALPSTPETRDRCGCNAVAFGLKLCEGKGRWLLSACGAQEFTEHIHFLRIKRHVACVNRATALFAARLAGKVMVSVQNPVLLSRYTEPQPDIVLARPRDDYYASARISPENTFLVIEISDTTLRYDRHRKMPLYAKSGVSELWIENLQNDVILVYRDPGPKTYSTSLTVHRGESISLAAFPDVVFKVDELLG